MTRLLYYRYVFHKDDEAYGFGDEYGEWHNVNLNVSIKEPCDNGRTSLEFRWLEPKTVDIQNRMVRE